MPKVPTRTRNFWFGGDYLPDGLRGFSKNPQLLQLGQLSKERSVPRESAPPSTHTVTSLSLLPTKGTSRAKAQREPAHRLWRAGSPQLASCTGTWIQPRKGYRTSQQRRAGGPLSCLQTARCLRQPWGLHLNTFSYRACYYFLTVCSHPYSNIWRQMLWNIFFFTQILSRLNFCLKGPQACTLTIFLAYVI